MSAVMSPSLSSFSASSSPPPSPQQIRLQQTTVQQSSPRSSRSGSVSNLSAPSAPPSASPSNITMAPPPVPSPGTAASSITSPRLKRPLSDETLNSNPRAPSSSPQSSGTTEHRGSPRPRRQGQMSVTSSPRSRQSPLLRRAAESSIKTPQNQAKNPTTPADTAGEASLEPLTLGSPSKRAKPAQPVKKLVPRDYALCSMNDLVVLISDMLNQLVSLNDGIPLTQGGLTRFHSRAPPTISITDYLQRIALHTTLEPSTLLSTVYYIDLLSNHYPAFTISSLTVHRFLITAATVSSKGLCDSFCTNTFYARVGGISLRELNVLELEFLSRVGWRIVPRPEVLKEYYASLVRRMGDSWGFEEADSENSSDDFLDENNSGDGGTGSLASSEASKSSSSLKSKTSFLPNSAPGAQEKDAPGESTGTTTSAAVTARG